jgi:DNA-binding response OmpR family regulator
MGVEGTRVIIVEDEALLSLDMEDQVTEAGCIIAGTAARIDQAMHLAGTADFDVALLDMNLAGERIDPVARLISARGLPIIFVTGYGQRTLPPGIAAPVLDKPSTVEKLLPLIAAVREPFCA